MTGTTGTTTIRSHQYRVSPEKFEEFSVRRAAVIDAVRAKHPALAATRLVRLEDGSYSDVWVWESAEHMGRALADLPNTPEAFAAMSMVEGNVAQSGLVLDER
ncbi:hypothetical protein [Catenulispora rubra]|uniref:hypothetical protein n=1 Tax=Catenulispora rubra TaxID=280293 RepID=UPI00189214EA|nr:hypothetical protein [Catenulispora rubra]